LIFYKELGDFFYNKGYLNKNISAVQYYKVFLEFNSEYLNQDNFKLKDIVKYDYLKFNKKRWVPDFLYTEKIKDEERTIKNMIKNGKINIYGDYHIEKFFIDINKFKDENTICEREEYIVFYGDEMEDTIYMEDINN
jgi:hypothetical protein